MLTHANAPPPSSNDPVIAWLLDSDASIRWQVMRDLTGAAAEAVAAERSRVASEGWGRRLLDEQRPDGQWGDGVSTPFWWSNLYSLLFLRDLGIDPASAGARTAIDRVRRNVTWGPGFGNSPFFEGEVEPCINGRVVALGAYFGIRSDRLVERLLGEQLADGGWNCEAERGSVRSSFHTTICVLEGLLAFEEAFGAAPAIARARERAQEYLLERRLLRRLSTGEIIEPAWTAFAFPTLWHYDVLRALDYLRAAAVQPDARVEEASAIVLRRSATGAGCSTCGTATRCTRRSRVRSGRRTAGSPSVRCECCAGPPVATSRAARMSRDPRCHSYTPIRSDRGHAGRAPLTARVPA